MNTQQIAIDGFRFIDNLHTTARQIPVFTEIIRLLNYKQLHKRILQQLMIEWSINEEEKNNVYRTSKGKLTNNGKQTIALRYHLELSPALGLTTRYNDLYMNTKISRVFVHFLNNQSQENFFLLERLFYVFQLLVHDADGIILCLGELYKKTEKNQRKLQDHFKDALNIRLSTKQESAPENVKFKISEKYRSINYIWKKPEKYAEHIIAPRYEWLCYLDLINIKREQRTTSYSLSEKGMLFYETLPYISQDKRVRDINDEWLQNHLFEFLSKVYNAEVYSHFVDLNEQTQNDKLGDSLEKALNAIQSSMSFKIPVVEALLFICLDMFINKKIILNFKDVRDKLKNTFAYANRTFLLKQAGRANEGYITIIKKK